MAFQAASNDRRRDNYRRSALSNGWRVGLRAFLYDVIRHLGVAIIASSTNRDRYHAGLPTLPIFAEASGFSGLYYDCTI